MQGVELVNIYEVLDDIIVNDRYGLSSQLFKHNDRELLSEKDKTIFDLLKNISSIGTKVYNTKIEFHPMLVMSNGKRTYSVDDITDEDYSVLTELEFDRIPIALRVLIADILWVYKKDYKAATVAANSYWEFFKILYKPGGNVETLDLIRRAVCISIQIKSGKVYNEICEWLNDYLKNEAVTNNGFYTLRLMELFAEQKKFDVSVFLEALDELINNNDNIAVIEQSYNLKSRCLFKLQKKEEAKSNNLLLAEYYLTYAESIVESNIQNTFNAVEYYRKGILFYRNNGEPLKAEEAQKRLVEIQKVIPQIITPVLHKFDIKDLVDNIRINMDGLTFEECVLRITQMISFEKKEELKKLVIRQYTEHPLAYIFVKKIINSQGQTVLVLPPLDLKNPEKDLSILELHMHQKALEIEKLEGDIWIKYSLEMLRDNFLISAEMLEFLVKDNPIIPEGREKIFTSGLCLFLKGNYYEAMHILAPQTENLFRNIAKEVGGLTVTLENDGSSMEKVLSSIFSLPELLDCYDNDILFIIEGLLNEQAGANIRNEIAHGIISEYFCSSGACLYFGAAIIKLLSYTSTKCYQILKSSKKLQKYELPNEKALRIIK